MVRIFFLTAGLSCLGACANGPFNGGGAYSGASSGAAWSASGPGAGAFRFDWHLSGDPAVAPMQVFDDGQAVWLQFAPGQPLPAIFGVRGSAEQPLPYRRREPYVVVSGDWRALRFRGGRLAARAERDADEALPSAPPSASSSALPSDASASSSASPAVTSPSGVGELAAGGPLRAPKPEPARPAAAIDVLAVDAAPSVAQASPQAPRYRAASSDATLRGVLTRWAHSSGWTFAPQHWAVDVDIPLSAAADFNGDFKSAVRELLGATELAEKPLQPCFYGNRVLRVVPLAQSCSRAAVPYGGGA